MDILLLFAQKLRANGVERVAPQFMLTLHVLKNVELQPTVYVRLL